VARPRRVTANFRGVPHPLCQTLNEHDRAVMSTYISMRTEATVDGPELHVSRALCSSSRLRSVYFIHFENMFGS